GMKRLSHSIYYSLFPMLLAGLCSHKLQAASATLDATGEIVGTITIALVENEDTIDFGRFTSDNSVVSIVSLVPDGTGSPPATIIGGDAVMINGGNDARTGQITLAAVNGEGMTITLPSVAGTGTNG